MIEVYQSVAEIFTVSWLTSQLTSNDFLVAGLFAALAYMARDIPNRIWTFIKRQITLEFTLTNEDADYHDIVTFLEARRFKMFSRTYTKKPESDDRSLTIGYGSSWFWYGCVGYITREFKENNHSNQLKEEIFIKLFTRNPARLQAIVFDATAHKNADNDTINVYLPNRSYWSLYSRTLKRNFDSIWIDETIKNQIVQSLDNFLTNKKWYLEKGIPYKFGIFIEGAPGTGKSSLVRAICSYLNRGMFFLTSESTQSAKITETLTSYCEDAFYGNNSGVLILEELDTFTTITNRSKDENDDDGTSKADAMSVILNTLDGALTPDNFIFIATTNHPDRIDPAIKRPGRFDLVIKIDRLCKPLFVQMVARLFDVPSDRVEQDFINYTPITGADVQGTFIIERNYSKAVHILREKM